MTMWYHSRYHPEMHSASYLNIMGYGRGGGIRRRAPVICHVSECTGLLLYIAETTRFPSSLWVALLSIDSFLGNQFPQKAVSLVSPPFFCVRHLMRCSVLAKTKIGLWILRFRTIGEGRPKQSEE